MFLYKTAERNPSLIKAAIELHQNGSILPDTFVLDYDQIQHNATHMIEVAQKHQIDLFMMTKQLGRNPLISKMLIEVGFAGAVTVDYKEALLMIQHGIPLAHVGHLVQTPTHVIRELIKAKPKLMTVFSVDKAREIHEMSRLEGHVQPIMLRMIGEQDVIYDSQQGGIKLSELAATVAELTKLSHISIEGVTSFPCFLYDSVLQDVVATPNVQTLQEAAYQLRYRYDQPLQHINMPSATCAYTLPKISAEGGTQGEPGHGLTGTTPMHAVADLAETPSILYVSEVSHNFDRHSYCYGGGHYRRSGVDRAYVATRSGELQEASVDAPEASSIDYYFGLSDVHPIGSTVLMAFRSQIFVTRSDVAVVGGLHSGHPQLLGVYDSLGQSKSVR
ncbi:alanine racemase [Paenibacillus sp. ACRRX]|uniref:alanine racemase n=1 Tax=Paenibacillus sp. ACRRX TaxID=2918206 RepID=UPI001EF54608|nr:alanine racemase [Paenibacillus sp. ACRRX]MCG7406967.1 alanine racemase [Paenibacillus sp. ACRRX]